MRTKQAFKNLVASLLLEAVLALSGLIIPRFFTALYGSSMNGLVSSVNQFISYMCLVEAGVGAAGTVALYGPLAQKNYLQISEIVSAARAFYMRSGWIFIGLVAALVGFYPLIVQNQIADAGFVRMMIVILSLSGIVDYFILGKYRVLLMADQKGYVIYTIQIIGTILMTIASIVLIELECSALLVKGVASAIYVLRSIAVALYVKKRYPEVNFNAKPDMSAFKQRWSALLHQIVTLVVNNTAVILMTVMLPINGLAEVSVYNIYNLVGYAIANLLNSISNGVRSSFGQVMANNETEVLRKSYSSYEYIFFIFVFFCYICMGVLLYPFISLYSADFTDGVVYLRWPLVALFTAVGFIQSIRVPALTVLLAAGHYRETQGRAIAEATINFVVSLSLIRPLGIIGVLIGSLVSYLYRSADVILYTAKHFVPKSLKKSIVRLLRNGITSAVLIMIGLKLLPMQTDNWFAWFALAVVFAICCGVVLLIVNIAFERNEFLACVKRIKDMFVPKHKTEQ